MILDSPADGLHSMGPDLNQAVTRDWPQHKYPDAKRANHAEVSVVLKQSVINEIHLHGLSRMDVEVCGVLVGNGYRDESGPFVYVEASIRGEHASNETAQVTFTAATWNHIQAVMDRDHPNLRILGWYHTHPGFGIFLSPMDLFIHDNFFSSPEQLAVVYDPHTGEQGVFLWRSGKATRETISTEENEPSVNEVELRGITRRPQLTAAGTVDVEIMTRLVRLEERQRKLFAGLLLVLAIVIGWPWWLWHFESKEAPKSAQSTSPGNSISEGEDHAANAASNETPPYSNAGKAVHDKTSSPAVGPQKGD